MILKFMILAVFLQLALSASLANKEEAAAAAAIADSQSKADVKELENMLIREMLENVVLRSKINSIYENSANANSDNADQFDDDDENDNSSEENEKRAAGAMVKRFPKWRSGDTRSRVRLLHQQQQHQHQPYRSHHGGESAADYSALLRNRWENNMLEKNKMYQNMLG